MEERLQKIISRAGAASRRKAEALITMGQVRVNGRVVRELGSKADPRKDEIRVEGKLISIEGDRLYFLLNKPTGYVTTTQDPEGRHTVLELVRGVRDRIYPVGRLDWDTSGLLILTNDGELTHLLTHPSSEVPRTYQAKVEGIPTPEALAKLAQGVLLDGRLTRPAQVRLYRRGPAYAWLEITLSEGRNRQVRRMAEAIGHPVIKLHRAALGPLNLADLPIGRFRPLREREVKALYQAGTVRRKKTAPAKSGRPPVRKPARSAGAPRRAKPPASRDYRN